ncbi:MAG: biotin--[acetyl-CoA-carboxylase] ligase, partial [Oscillospiraceae bacterium]|nr:biotin--[acetyl-CoA-carboxylase] ligase [Oscillospiraceae bacterium]
MSIKKAVLTMLEKNRERYISGQEFAETLDVSRTAVWKAVRALREEGHVVGAANNRGYRLDSDLLSAEGVRAALPAGYQSCPVSVLSVTDSTNTQAKKLAADGARHGTLLLAEEQTAGRGRSGKRFFSPRGLGLYMSVILRPDAATVSPRLVTLAAAVSVCRAVEALTGLEPRIKWVNDVYLDGKKICGILTEAVMDMESGGIDSIIVGVGVNCAVEEAILPPELHGIVGSIGAGKVPRCRLAALIAVGVLEAFANLSDPDILGAYR